MRRLLFIPEGIVDFDVSPVHYTKVLFFRVSSIGSTHGNRKDRQIIELQDFAGQTGMESFFCGISILDHRANR